MHTYTLSEEQRHDIEMIMATCLVSLAKMSREMKNKTNDEYLQLKRAEVMYLSFSELFKNPKGGQSPLDKFSYQKI